MAYVIIVEFSSRTYERGGEGKDSMLEGSGRPSTEGNSNKGQYGRCEPAMRVQVAKGWCGQKVKVLTRAASSHQTPGSSVTRQPRNLDPALHPFERAREYTRALNATKLERMFAAPFLGQLGKGHVDGVYTMARDPRSLERLASGSGDGVLKVWDLTTREEIWHTQAHQGIVKGSCWTEDGKLLSCASDRSIKLFDPYHSPAGSVPIASFLGSTAFTGVSYHRTHPTFAASSTVISIYDLSRPSSTPIQNLAWPNSTDTINTVSFNQTETSILASTATDRSICLYDLRTSSPIAKSVLRLASNAVSWNPMEAINFAVANEDHNIYLFDMRNLDRALNVLRDHVHAVMDVDFSPTGEELVSASYDRSVRIWKRSQGHSRDVYHTKRMQRYASFKRLKRSTSVTSHSGSFPRNSRRILIISYPDPTMETLESGVQMLLVGKASNLHDSGKS